MERKSDTADREIAIKRVFNAPRSLVWTAWTDPKHVAQWWGPTGFTNTIHKMEVKVGGVWDFIMHGDRKSTRLNSSHIQKSRMPSSA